MLQIGENSFPKKEGDKDCECLENAGMQTAEKLLKLNILQYYEHSIKNGS